MSAPFVDETLPANAGVLRYLRPRNERGLPLCAAPDEVAFDPYLSLGSHPDVVERVWRELRADLPDEARCVVLGTPALADPSSGLVLAVALGTSYALRVEADDLGTALEAGAEQRHRYGRTGPTLDVSAAFGPSWIFGSFDRREPEWVQRAAGSASSSAS